MSSITEGSCAICAQLVDKTGILRCGHCLCQECILSLMEIRFGEYLILCPSCNSLQSLNEPSTSALEVADSNGLVDGLSSDLMEFANSEQHSASENAKKIARTPAINAYRNLEELLRGDTVDFGTEDHGAAREAMERLRIIEREKIAFEERVANSLERQIGEVNSNIDLAIANLERARLVMVTCAQRNAERLMYIASRSAVAHLTAIKERSSGNTNESVKRDNSDWMPPSFDSLIDQRLIQDLHSASLAVRILRRSTNEFDDRVYDSRNPSSIVDDTQVLMCVGGSSEAGCVASVEAFDPDRGSWQSITEMNCNRFFAAAAALKGRLIVAGGSDGQSVLNSVEQFDASSNSWSPFIPLNQARWQHALVSCDKNLYAIGGCFDQKRPVDSVDCFSAETNCWAPVSPLLVARSRFAAAVIDQAEADPRIIAAGGFNGRQCLSNCEMFDIMANKWSTVCPLNVARSSFGMAYVDTRRVVYAVGGRDMQGCHRDDIEQYDVNSDKWTILSVNLSIGRSRLSIGCVEDRVIIVGGWSKLGRLASIDILNTDSDSLESQQFMRISVARSCHSLVCVRMPAAAAARLFEQPEQKPALGFSGFTTTKLDFPSSEACRS